MVPLRGRLVHHYALFPTTQGEKIVLIDGGFLSSGPSRWLPVFHEQGFAPDRIGAILLTHGHIDHVLNLRVWQEATGAEIFAPLPDRNHIAGKHPYSGITRLCGAMEGAARALLSYRMPERISWFEPGASFPFAGGLVSIPLPGHTDGHCGFYSHERKILFSGDLFSWFRRQPKLPPPWFNTSPSQLERSLARAVSLDLAGGVLPNHCHLGSPDEYRDALLDLATRYGVLAGKESD